ncbi:MAG: peptidyl-prolyl cis-trans isomerase [Deltaproteobacteria bacterium]|nr:peptidyl-prolyl cis-trans isomerase [Deltaproteobacteria bacterium]
MDKIVVLVDDKVITQSDIQQASANPAPTWKRGRDGVIQGLISEKLIETELEREKISVTEADVDASIKSVLDRSGKTMEDLKGELIQREIPLVSYRESIKMEVARGQFLQKVIYPRVKVTDLDLQDYYKRNGAGFKSYGKIRFLEIYITSGGLPPGQSAADFAGRLAGSLKQGASFADAARKYSKGGFAENGGDSGVLETNSLRPELAQVLTALPLGTVSDPIPMGDGLFIFKVTEREDSRPRVFAEVKESLREKVAAEKMQNELERYIMEIRPRHHIEIR